jgi:hypothetical protein
MPFALPTDASSLGAESGTESSLAPASGANDRSWPYALIGLVVLLAGYVGYMEWAAPKGSSHPAITPLTNAERLAEDTSLTGVYTTGSEPGQHGIIILGDGKLKLFQVNAQAAPSVVYGSYRFGRLDSKLCLDTDQPGGLVKVLDRESLEFCGEVYRRIP